MKTSTDIRLILPLVVAVAHLTATPMLAAEVLLNDSFEHGGDAPDGWIQGGAVAGVSYIYDSKVASSGKCSLSLQKSANRFFPIAQWTREIPLDRDIKQLHVACDARATRVTKAIVDLQFFDAHGNPLGHEWAVFIGQKQSSDRPVTHDGLEPRDFDWHRRLVDSLVKDALGS